MLLSIGNARKFPWQIGTIKGNSETELNYLLLIQRYSTFAGARSHPENRFRGGQVKKMVIISLKYSIISLRIITP